MKRQSILLIIIVIVSGFLMGVSFSDDIIKKYTKNCIKEFHNVNLRTSLEKHFRIKITPERQKNICACNINELQKRLTEKQFLRYSKKVLTDNERYFLQAWTKKCYESNIRI